MRRVGGEWRSVGRVEVVCGCGVAEAMGGERREGGGERRRCLWRARREAGEWLQANVRSGDAVLLKASRGVRLERALEALVVRVTLRGEAGESNRNDDDRGGSGCRVN